MVLRDQHRPFPGCRHVAFKLRLGEPFELLGDNQGGETLRVDELSIDPRCHLVRKRADESVLAKKGFGFKVGLDLPRKGLDADCARDSEQLGEGFGQKIRHRLMSVVADGSDRRGKLLGAVGTRPAGGFLLGLCADHG
jgi:hypothetical protein